MARASITLAGGRDPWGQQPDETPRDYARFRRYLEAGPKRTQKQISEAEGLTPAAVSLIARANLWKRRARAWDQNQGHTVERPDRVLRLDDRLDPWEQQPGEPDRAFGFFQAYLQLGRTRTSRKTTEKLNNQAREAGAGTLSAEAVQQYSYRYRWPERAAAFDAHMDAQWRAALHEHGRRMVQEHLKAGKKLLEAAQEALGVLDVHELAPGDVAKFFDLYSKLTRVALGEPEHSVAVTGAHGGPVQITAVPEDEVSREAQMRAATLELAKRLGTGAVELDDEAVLELPE